MPRPRFTVRGLMLVVAVVAIIIAAEQMWRKRVACLEIAEEQAAFERIKLDSEARSRARARWGAEEARRLERSASIPIEHASMTREAVAQAESDRKRDRRSVDIEMTFAHDMSALADRFRSEAAEHRRLCNAFRRVADYPWLPTPPLPPDPPPPDDWNLVSPPPPPKYEAPTLPSEPRDAPPPER